MSSSYWRPAFLIVAVAAFIGGAVAVQSYTINRLLYHDAVSTGRNWTEYLASNIKDLEAIASGQKPSLPSLAFLEQGKKVGQVFLYKIFNAKGQLRYISDETLGGVLDEQALANHNPEAAKAVEAKESIVEVKEGTPPRRPPFYAETYVPVVVGGEVTAVIETYIDQTDKRAEFQSILLFAAIALSLLVALAFGLPAAAWYWRKREQERADAHIHFLANFDALSGLANRARLTDGLARALTEAAVSGKPLAVHCVDIDHFKDINDTLGLAAGDLMLKIVADRLKSIANPADIVARLAGDEFAIVQMMPRDRAGAEAFARRITWVMNAPAALNGHDVALTVGVGVAVAPDHGNDADRLIKSAELALAKGKSEGRARVCFFTHDLDSELRARLRLERAIDAAIANNGFQLHYQPLYSEPGETLTGFEALARLPNGSGGFIPPAEFIPAAERMGAINRLGAWVLQEACTTAATWPEHLTVSVNLSPAQFGHDRVASVVADALTASGLAPERLLLEITESLLLKDSEAIMAELTKLKALGTRIVMDDFGTGYSSLSYLWRFPFDKIKIDGSFMRAFDTADAPAEKIVRTVATLGHTLNMRVCVEGVETARHAGYARTLGCDEVQGYYFGMPAPAADLAAVILADFQKATADVTDGRRGVKASA